MTYRIGVDIGGTFTDFALYDDEGGIAFTHKQLTTPANPAQAVIEGVSEIIKVADVPIGQVRAIAHGTTLVTNAIIERKGVPTALVVTAGFADVIDIGLERRYDLFDLRICFPETVVPRNLRIEVNERMRDDGSVIEAPGCATLEASIRELVEHHAVRAVAVCLLHSYANPAHEQFLGDWIRQRFPDLHVSLSSTIFPYMREYERWITTCLNAYVQPAVDSYLGRLEEGLHRLGFSGKFLVMSSSGGTLASSVARQFPIRLLESGPAAGALMSSKIGTALDEANVLSFDMGGTTAKGCIIRGGRPIKRYEMEVARVHEFKAGSGLPAKIPVIDMIEIGAGGGSLANIDERRVLRMGPRSAGAQPGPASYGQGGNLPTLTDANLLLGYLGSDSFLGGGMRLDDEAASEVVRRHVAAPLDVELVRAAWGMHEVINEDVARAFRVHASERGVDYRRCIMVAFGGSGPLHGARVARKLKIPRVICPAGAGVMSAFGLLSSPPIFEVVLSHRAELASLSEASLQTVVREMEEQAAQALAESRLDKDDIQFDRRVDMRYVGQGYEVEVELPDWRIGGVIEALPAAFSDAYKGVFGMDLPDRPIEIVNLKIEARGRIAGKNEIYRLSRFSPGKRAEASTRKAWFPEFDGYVDCPVMDRYAMSAGDVVRGPALIEERESTCVIGPQDTLHVDQLMNLVIEIG